MVRKPSIPLATSMFFFSVYLFSYLFIIFFKFIIISFAAFFLIFFPLFHPRNTEPSMTRYPELAERSFFFTFCNGVKRLSSYEQIMRMAATKSRSFSLITHPVLWRVNVDPGRSRRRIDKETFFEIRMKIWQLIESSLGSVTFLKMRFLNIFIIATFQIWNNVVIFNNSKLNFARHAKIRTKNQTTPIYEIDEEKSKSSRECFRFI